MKRISKLLSRILSSIFVTKPLRTPTEVFKGWRIEGNHPILARRDYATLSDVKAAEVVAEFRRDGYDVTIRKA